jgi:DnaA N-terminal domain
VGRNAMRDWKAAVRTWERNGVDGANGNGKPAQRDSQEPIQPKPLQAVTYDIPAGIDASAGKKVWETAQRKLSKRVNPHSFDTWLKPVKAAGIRDNVLYLTLPTAAFSEVQRKYGDLTAEVLGGLRVEYLVPEEKAS